MSEALVSIIMPIHNAAPYLDDAIASVVAQTHAAWHLHLVDDASTDDSRQIAQARAGGNEAIHLVRLGENVGPAAARNAALSEAKGEFVTFLDADDLMPPSRLEIQIQYFASHPAVDVVVGAEESIIEPDAAPSLVRRRRQTEDARFYPMSMMVRRPALDRVGGFDPSYRVGEDLDWLFRAGRAGLVIATLPNVLTMHRIHAHNLSESTGAIQESILRSLRSGLTEHA